MNGKQLKNSILQWAIQGKLVPQNPKDEPASKLLERIAAQRVIASGAKQSKKTPASRLPAGRQCIYREGSSWFEESKDTQGLPAGRRDITEEIPFDIPESWEWCRFSQVISIASNLVDSSKYLDYKHIAPDNIEKCSGKLLPCRTVAEDKVISNNHFFAKGQIIYSKIRPLLRKCVVAPFDGLCSADMYPLRPYIDDFFVVHILLSDMFNKQVADICASRVKMPKINQEELSGILIPLPPLAEQKRIVKKLEQILPLVDEYDQAQTQLDKLNKELPEALKKSILQQAIQGKLVPPACRLAGRTQNLPGFEKGKWYTYVIECEDGSFYKGHTSNLSNRFKEHCAGKGADWTASHKPKQVYYYEVHYGEEEAISREKYLKSGAGREWFQKEVVNSPENWESAQKLLERIIATRNGCSINQGVILSEAQSAKSKNPAKKKSKNETSRIYRDTDGLWYEQTGSSEPVNISEEIPFEIPETWTWIRLNYVCDIARGGSPRPIQDYLTDSSDGYNWIKIGDTEKGGKYINSTKEKIKPEGLKKSRLIHKGDFLLTNSMSFGRPYISNIEGCIHDGWLVISMQGESFDSDYLYYLLSSQYAYNQFCGKVAGAVVKNLNSDKVAESLIPLPPLAEQKRIVAKLEQLFKAL